MSIKKPILVILGSSVTALAVARSAKRINLSVLLVDTQDGIAMRTNSGRSEILDAKNDYEIMQAIVSMGEEGNNFLVASSDAWLRFIFSWRSELEVAYRSVLHSDNKTLSICLHKAKLSEWCLENNVCTPRCYTMSELNDLEKTPVSYPVFVRPEETLLSNCDLPKAVEIDDGDYFRYWMERFQDAGVPAVVTESLLSHELTQYSVGLARDGKHIVSFVAKKTRPLPAQCAVGSFVELSPNKEVEKMARRIAEALDYYGMAEFEIFYSQNTKQAYLIEINARPWLQYTLAAESGHDFLTFLLYPQYYDSSRERKEGKYWLDFINDFFNCFSNSIGLVRHGYVGWREYLYSLLLANAHSMLNIRDPRPACYALWLWLRTMFGGTQR